MVITDKSKIVTYCKTSDNEITNIKPGRFKKYQENYFYK